MSRIDRTSRRISSSPLRIHGFTLIELLVVIGIAAMLITLATTSFFGAMRREGVTKSRNQLRDILLTARQQACILGKTHVVVCWNTDSKVAIGEKTNNELKQGRFALFQYVGDVWSRGNALYTPFGIQSELLATLKHGARAISLNAPDAAAFARITNVVRTPTKTDEEVQQDIDNSMTEIEYDYRVGGDSPSETWRPEMYKIAEYTGSLKATEKNRIPLAIRVTSAFSLPQYYAFNKDRVVFIFEPDGCLSSESDRSVSGKHSVSTNARNATFSISVASDGVVTINN